MSKEKETHVKNKTISGRCVGGKTDRTGRALVNLVAVIAILFIMAGMLSPVMRTTREAARRTDCANRLRQVVLGMHSYHDANQHLPSAMGDPAFRGKVTPEAAARLNGLVMVLPYLEAQSMWKQIQSTLVADDIMFPAGPPPWTERYPPWQQGLPEFQCPSSAEHNEGFAHTNYAFCIGDMARSIHAPPRARGAFAVGLRTSFLEVSDGTSRTMAFAEIATPFEHSVNGNYAVNQTVELLNNPADCLQLIDQSNRRDFLEKTALGSSGRGARWADGAAEMTLFNTILGPGSPSAAIEGHSMVDGIYSATAWHAAGVNVALLDGSIRNVSRDVDAGDPTVATPLIKQLSQPGFATPYGVWGQLGGRDDGGVPLDF